MLKIAHTYPGVLRMHGATKVLLLFTATLEQMGHHNTIYCTHFNIDTPFWFKGNIKSIFPKKKGEEKSGLSKLLLHLSEFFWMIFLPFYIPRETDVIVLHSEASTFAIPLAKLLFGKKKIVYYCYQIPRELYDRKEDSKKTYGVWYWLFLPFLELYKILHRWLVRSADHVLVWSPQSVEQARGVFGECDYHVVPTGVDFSLYELNEQAKAKVEELRKEYHLNGKKVLLMNASLVVKKNIPEYIKLIRKLLDKGIDVHGFNIGEGPEREAYEGIIQEQGVKDNFSLLGYVSQEELPLYYHLADLLLFLEFDGPWTMSIIEAGAASKPVVVGQGGSMPTLVNHEKSGYTIRDLDEDLEGKVTSLLQNDDLREGMGKANYEHSLQFDEVNCVNKFLELFNE